ncbi:hypothetical protein WM40_03480 [Robbsia andropogonis]|uniref:Uncharacterized protein n=1 Tax=Robbsia andropogonis TaxID=28092 RepID=A0A0F5K512_9BURK|nr:hypothetical protein WM40_03480 [Robbsia andropogonis]
MASVGDRVNGPGAAVRTGATVASQQSTVAMPGSLVLLVLSEPSRVRSLASRYVGFMSYAQTYQTSVCDAARQP